ncbi:type I-MYXAN CRISPR-associated endonuclease Cas1 [Leptolyngbya sp. NK1-12]|uniref:CRISPR-associated endonuclease Cas1 n=1 Tax=Leptolyngbya sp. NK1-12 TaxID=2547451 RepID=A0AA97AHH0_9CYAN|nr:type I-MYXAN CRISPR-associated endonuclease Cas1 [Leptolyngbya sp. NK1-12]WNZ25455.1 type I-MYXAN CRISPR-associated endonuclease Cas1 [Leptolyngbya sp. NK1-12]
MNGLELPDSGQETLRVSSLHALAYCPRLFYLEEVEELYAQDDAVFAGRRLHVEIEKEEGDEYESLMLESEALGLRGKVDALRTRSGQTIPYEHKRGRCRRDEHNQPQAWDSDRLQILAYACLIEAALGITVTEGRIRYHADNVLVKVPLDEQGRQEVRQAIQQARQLRCSTERPPVTSNERLCVRCSLAPVCLPEETRFAQFAQFTQDEATQPTRLFPEDDDREIIHILEPGACVGRSGDQIKINRKDESAITLPARQVGQIVLHSYSQISTQALYFCAEQQIGVHFISGGGRYLGSFNTRQGSIQRRIRQYRALSKPDMSLKLARQLVLCRGQSQRRFLMRGQRNLNQAAERLQQTIDQMERLLRLVPQAESLDRLLGLEGNLASLYFGALPCLIGDPVPAELRFNGRNRRPPRDRFNALLGFGYALLLKDVINSILVVGLEPVLGFYHQPRTQAPPLGLDLMEIFRVPLVDMPVIGAVNRGQWDIKEDFEVHGNQVWLSDSGRRKFINLYERRKQETWKHPILKYSLTYRRLMELEVRLLEKEWMDEGNLFGHLVIR